jgi:hypothetical protein
VLTAGDRQEGGVGRPGPDDEDSEAA